MSLYLSNQAHTGTTTSNLKISKNIMLKLKCYLNVTEHPSGNEENKKTNVKEEKKKKEGGANTTENEDKPNEQRKTSPVNKGDHTHGGNVADGTAPTPESSNNTVGKGIRQRAAGSGSGKGTTTEKTENTTRAPTTGQLPPFLPPTIIKTTSNEVDLARTNGQQQGGGAEILSSAGAHGAPSHDSEH